MPSAAPRGTSKSTYTMPSSVRPYSGDGAWQRTRLPQGQVASTTSPLRVQENLVFASGTTRFISYAVFCLKKKKKSKFGTNISDLAISTWASLLTVGLGSPTAYGLQFL